MAAAAILDFRNFKFLTVWTVKKIKLHHCVKFCRIRSNRSTDRRRSRRTFSTHFCEYRSRGSSWAMERETKDRTGLETSLKGLYFTYLWRSPHWSDAHENLFNRWRSRRKHLCHVSKWNFLGLQFYKGSNVPFNYRFLNEPYNIAALLRCLWL